MGFFGKKKHIKIGAGAWGDVYSINYPCPNFKSKTGFVSKMVSSRPASDIEIKILEKVKKLDVKQEYLSTFESHCKPMSFSQWFWYSRNIIMKNNGISLNNKKYKHKSINHIINVFLKQTLKGLSLLHKGDIYHRDIAVRNILYKEEENKYRLIDFGYSLIGKDIDNKLTHKKLKEDFAGNILDVIDRGDGNGLFPEDGSEFKKVMNILGKDGNPKDKEKKILKLNLDVVKKEVRISQAEADVSSLFNTAMEILMNNENILMKDIEDLFDKLNKILLNFYEINSKMGIADYTISKLKLIK